MSKPLLLYPYAAVWRLARPFLRRHKRLSENFGERLVPPHWPCADINGLNNPVGALPCRLWLHAASGGEAYLVREILQRLSPLLAEKQVKLSVLCTSMTRQGLEVLGASQQDFSSAYCAVMVNYLPLDEPDLMQRALLQAFGSKPKEACAVVLLETEIWPGLLWACRELGVPSYILNGRMTPASFKSYRHIAASLRKFAPKKIMASSPDDAERFKEIFAPEGATGSVSLMPNIKFDRVEPVRSGYTSALQALLGENPPQIVLFASVREEEEAGLSEAIADIRRSAPDACIIVAPRHLHRAEAWAERLSDFAGLKRRSQGIVGLNTGDVVLWDAFGELMELYGIADTTFVGGSLAPLGGQNFLEPLAYGLVPVIGPSWSNFYWVGQDLFGLGLVRKIDQAVDLPAVILEQLESRTNKDLVKEKFSTYLKIRQGGSQLAVDFLLRELKIV